MYISKVNQKYFVYIRLTLIEAWIYCFFQVEKLEKYTFSTPQRLEKISKSQEKKLEFNFELLDTLF